MKPRADTKLQEDIARLNDIAGYKRLVEFIRSQSEEADKVAVYAVDQDTRTVMAGKARAYRELLDLMTNEYRRS